MIMVQLWPGFFNGTLMLCLVMQQAYYLFVRADLPFPSPLHLFWGGGAKKCDFRSFYPVFFIKIFFPPFLYFPPLFLYLHLTAITTPFPTPTTTNTIIVFCIIYIKYPCNKAGESVGNSETEANSEESEANTGGLDSASEASKINLASDVDTEEETDKARAIYYVPTLKIRGIYFTKYWGPK